MWQKAIHKFYLGLFNYSPIWVLLSTMNIIYYVTISLKKCVHISKYIFKCFL
jgi:hypothetical protein